MASSLPAKMKLETVDQIDHILTIIGSAERITVTMLPRFVDGHIATPVVLDVLRQIEGVELLWQSFNAIEVENLSRSPSLCLNEHGDVFVLVEKKGTKYQLQCNSNAEEGPKSFWITEHEMFNDMGIYPQALSITKKKPASALGQPLLPPPSKDAEDDESVAKEHYVVRHFRLQSRTALSIIGISVVIALLGVITPLGFQTFTDKILPYQAQSSLMVIAILLVVAAMMTALFNYYRDYQESVLFAKYQSGLGKEVFSRLLAMEVPYFDSRNVGELTKLVDQVEEASNFLVKQLLGAVVAVVAVVAVMEDHVEEVADQEAKMLW